MNHLHIMVTNSHPHQWVDRRTAAVTTALPQPYRRTQEMLTLTPLSDAFRMAFLRILQALYSKDVRNASPFRSLGGKLCRKYAARGPNLRFRKPVPCRRQKHTLRPYETQTSRKCRMLGSATSEALPRRPLSSRDDHEVSRPRRRSVTPRR